MRKTRWNLDVRAAVLALLCSTGYAADDSDLKPLSNAEAEAILTPPLHKDEILEPEDCQAMKSSLPGSKEYEIHEVGCYLLKTLNNKKLGSCYFEPVPTGSFKISLSISVRGEVAADAQNIDLSDFRIAECYADLIRKIKWEPRLKPFGPLEMIVQSAGWPKP